MPRLGRVIRSKGQELVIRAEGAPERGEKVHDKQNKIVGEVSDIFGPVNSPYVTVKLFQEAKGRRRSLEDKDVYLKRGKVHGGK